MTSERRFEQDLPALLAEVGLGPRPDYRDDIVRQTATVRQRPAWTLPERWLPMSVLTSRVASPPRVPLRLIAVMGLLILAIVGVLLVAGSRSRVPAPFGLAGNGLIAYSQNGNIYTGDPTSAAGAASVVSGSDDDTNPVFSLDGTRMVFLRASPGLNEARKQLYAKTHDSALVPYANWFEFGQGLRHSQSLVNFIAAYATVPVLIMVPWFISVIALLVEFNFRGFLLGRLAALESIIWRRTLLQRLSPLALSTSALVFAFDPFMVRRSRGNGPSPSGSV